MTDNLDEKMKKITDVLVREFESQFGRRPVPHEIAVMQVGYTVGANSVVDMLSRSTTDRPPKPEKIDDGPEG
jgi:acyl-CoA hydrolase